MGHDFHPSILRAYDIRGIVGDTLFAADAQALGRAFATRAADASNAAAPTVVVGRDGRLSSPELGAALIDGLTASGARVVDIGLGPTPMVYFAVHELGAVGGIQVTGSHNPPDHNGFKLMLGTGPFFGDDIQDLGRIAAGGEWPETPGSIEAIDVRDRYLNRLLQGFRGGPRELRVAWDAGNGAAGEVMTRLAAALPGRHHLLYEQIDGRFPNHHPDPTVAANLAQLIATVRAEGLDLGVAFDGDADRIGVVDARGRILFGDQILQILAADLLARRPGSMIIADVKASEALFDEIRRLGGEPLMWKTGHSLIKSKMRETGAPLAGEMSGHIFIADEFYGHDDALYVAVRLLDILSRSERSLTELHDAMPSTCATPETRFECPEEAKFEIVERVRRDLEQEGARFEAVDGVRVRTDDGWWLLRASNTQAILVVRAEAATMDGLDRLKRAVRDRLGGFGLAAPDDF